MQRHFCVLLYAQSCLCNILEVTYGFTLMYSVLFVFVFLKQYLTLIYFLKASYSEKQMFAGAHPPEDVNKIHNVMM